MLSTKYPTVDRANPEAAGRCDRGGELRKRNELKKEMIYAGNRLVWNGMLVCDKHRDRAQDQDRTVILRADPVPIDLPRPVLEQGEVP